ncbi:MAG TPA: phosphoglucomutase/phosphomannomutase family protein [Syntrophomonadaceae bacterium]|nr:phosphoglucomutase/phosphomannomutase family protein [Syntrophomonadaceae bacterium]
MNEIKFGTDGWRAVIADEFTFANVRLVAQAIAGYLKESGLSQRGIVIGYDNRFLSERFAAAVAEVLAGNDIFCWLPQEATPTPVTAYAIKENGAGGAVMITASHNPPEYNGIKFIPEYAGPAVPEITRAIEKNIRVIKSPEDVIRLPLDEARERGLIRSLDPKPGYLAHLRNILDYNAICGSNLKIVIDPMWGAGIGYVEEVFRGACGDLEFIHDYRDVLCGGSMPEPTAAGLSDLRKTVIAEKADLGLALDGDADRFGVIDRDGVYVTPNEILYLLLYYLLEYRRWRGAVARTVATTHMLDRIADDYGLPVVETPVGFKYIGQSLIHHRSILGGEESGGLSIQGHIPEKDGILALSLVVEMVAASGKSLREFQQVITAKFGRLVSARLDLKCDPRKKDRILARLREWSPRDLSGERVRERNLKDGVKLILESGDWVLVRPSGTESLFRIYAEASDEGRLRQLQEDARAALGL